MIFFLDGRPVSRVVRKFKCPLKKRSLLAQAVGLLIGGEKGYIEFGIALGMVMLIKVCLNESYRRLRVGKHLSDMFPAEKSLK
jgi:hypothetical protein